MQTSKTKTLIGCCLIYMLVTPLLSLQKTSRTI
nr:MAG TPA: hypothetical protein [Caudoviricetes sp.]